jgi:TPP-dependent indolepyruvate ferredoxin oxidoreductase alpha subunit
MIQVTPDREESLYEGGMTLPRDTGIRYKPQKSRFIKDPHRWAATPRFRYQLHKELNEKIDGIRTEFEQYPGNRVINDFDGSVGIITYKRQYLDFFAEDNDVLFLSTLYPLPSGVVGSFTGRKDRTILFEGLYPVISLQMKDLSKVTIERVNELPAEGKKRTETLYGFTVVRDTIGPASSINMAHGMRKTDPKKKILALTFEDFFLHSGMPAFVNVLYNNSSFAVVIMGSSREEEIRRVLGGFGFGNIHVLERINDIERFAEPEALTVFLWKGII